MQTLDNNIKTDITSDWFDDIVATLRVEQLAYNQGCLTKQKKELYESIANKDTEKLLSIQKQSIKEYEVRNVLTYYSELINNSNIKLKKLAINLRDSLILVWAEVTDNDEISQRELITAECKVNSIYYNKGYSIDTMIVEESDNINVPLHYKSVSIE